MRRLRAISVDDEARAHDVLRVLLKDTPDIELVSAFTSPIEALEAMNAGVHDLLFLDIAMPGISGLDFLRALKAPPVTVLLTAHMEHALVAFELGVRDYLTKPVSPERLQRCLEHIRPLLQAARAGARPPKLLSIKNGSAYHLIDPALTSHIEAAGNFSTVYYGDRALFASESLKDLQQRLAPLSFVRVHKSYAVNLGFVAEISANEVRLRDGLVLPLGRAYRGALANIAR